MIPVLDVHTQALWMPMSLPYGPVYYYRHAGRGYNIHAVMLKTYNHQTRSVEYAEKWALFKGKYQVHELLPVSGRDVCMEQAENWLKEQNIVS